jgi:dipeptidase
MMGINRSHLEGTIAEPRWGAAETFWATPCMHDTAHSGYHSAASVVAHLRAEQPSALRQVYWASFSNPCSNLFQPFYMRGPAVPENYARGSSTYSDESPWWWANRLKLLADLNYRAIGPRLREVFDATEKWELDRQKKVEAEALELIRSGHEAEATSALQKFINANTERARSEYSQLNSRLPEALAKTGSEYLYTDYIRGWTERHQVPLPLP